MKRLLALSLYALPVLYVAAILAVSIHEIIGHGLTTYLLGGIFHGATIRLDGMGWADVDPKGLSSSALALMFLGGAVSTGLFTVLFFGLTLVKRFAPLVRFSLVLAAFAFLLDGFPYYVWDSVFMGGIGDFSMIWNLYPSHGLRIAVAALNGTGMTVGIVMFNVIGYPTAGLLLGRDFMKKSARRGALHAVLLGVQAIFWFGFDWNQIVPGAGVIPSIYGMAIAILTLVILKIKRTRNKVIFDEPEATLLKKPLIAIWICCAVVVLLITFWLQKGI